MSLEDLAQCPERHPCAVRDAPTLTPGDIGHPLPELVKQPRLADARCRSERDQPRRALFPNVRQNRLERIELSPAPHERRSKETHTVEVAAKRERLPGLHRLSLALDDDRVDFPVLDDFGCCAEGSLADQYTVCRPHRLQPLPCVHDVP